MARDSDEGMMALFGANVSKFGDDVSVSGGGREAPGHARRSLVEGKGFANDWYKMYFEE